MGVAMSIDFLISDSPKAIREMLSLYASMDKCKFNIQHAKDNQYSTDISVSGGELDAVFVVRRDTPYTTLASLRIYDPKLDYRIRYEQQLIPDDERAKGLIDAFYGFVHWLRQQNRLVEAVDFSHYTDRFKTDLLDMNHKDYREPHRMNVTCQFFIPNELPSKFKQWWDSEKEIHSGYSIDGDSGDVFIPYMDVLGDGNKPYKLILYAFRADMFMQIIHLSDNSVDKQAPPKDHGQFALGEIIALNHGLQFRFWAFKHVSYGKFFLLELFERIKKRWSETNIEIGDWLDRESYNNPKALFDNQTIREKLDKIWYFEEGTSVFMGLAQEYFINQGAVFKLRREYSPRDINIRDAMGEDIPHVNEMALLSYSHSSGARQVWVNAVKRPVGCKITITEINQGWSYIEQSWNEFVNYLSYEGWKISTDKDKQLGSQANDQRQPILSKPPTEINWSEEPKSDDRVDWFKHRYFCKSNGLKTKTHSKMGSILGLEEQSCKNAYSSWAKKNGAAWLESVRNSTK